MKYFLVMNPGSRGGSSKKLFGKIFSEFGRKKVYYDYRITNSLDEIQGITTGANRNGYDVIAAVGGDGTINRVINGFYDDGGRRISNARLGIIYTGTSPDFCKSYGIPTNTDKALKVLFDNNIREIRVGRITLSKQAEKGFDGKTVDEAGLFDSALWDSCRMTCYFGCCANIGLGAALARRANSGIRKICGDLVGTFLALLRTLISYEPSDFRVFSDGCEERITRAYNLSIGKTHFIASGIKVKNSLSEGDQRFYKLSVRDLDAGRLIGVLQKVYSGKEFISDDVINLEYANVFDVCGNSMNAEVEFDGDPAGFLPCRIETAIDTLSLICGAS